MLEGMVPALSIFPSSSKSNEDEFQKCMLLLFKPFTTFQELYNGVGWDETYSEFLDTTERLHNIENIEEVHIGIDEKKENDDNDDNDDNGDLVDDTVDDEFDDDANQLNETDSGIDSQTAHALDVIINTQWLDESVLNHETKRNNMQPVLETSSRLPLIEMWTDDMDRQNQNILNNVEPDETESPEDSLSSETEFTTTNNNDVELSYEACSDDTQDDLDSLIENIVDNTIQKYNLNKKQTVAFKSVCVCVCPQQLWYFPS